MTDTTSTNNQKEFGLSISQTDSTGSILSFIFAFVLIKMKLNLAKAIVLMIMLPCAKTPAFQNVPFGPHGALCT